MYQSSELEPRWLRPEGREAGPPSAAQTPSSPRRTLPLFPRTAARTCSGRFIFLLPCGLLQANTPEARVADLSGKPPAGAGQIKLFVCGLQDEPRILFLESKCATSTASIPRQFSSLAALSKSTSGYDRALLCGGGRLARTVLQFKSLLGKTLVGEW